MGEQEVAPSEWTVVTKADKKRIARRSNKKRNLRGRASSTTIGEHIRATNQQFTTISNQEAKEWTKGSNDVVNQIKQFQKDFVRTDFYRSICLALKNISIPTFETIVCYGIGCFSKHRSAPMWQLVLSLCLRDYLMENNADRKELQVFFYDPCTTELEATVLGEHFDVTVLKTNERGRRPVNGRSTLFFMPHCPRKLYENVVLSNWVALEKVVLLGNSLQSYETRGRMNRPLSTCLQRILPHVNEVPVVASRRDMHEMEGYFEAAFNDTFLTRFVNTPEGDWPSKPDDDETDEADRELL